MAEMMADPLENQQNYSDSEFEKLQYPGDEEASSDVKFEPLDGSDNSQGSSSLSHGSVEVVQTGRKTGKSMLESNADEQEKPDAKCHWTAAIDPRVQDLIYWHDVRKTALVFSASLAILITLALFPLLSTLSYLSLFVLTLTFGCRLCGNVIAYVKKSKEKHLLNKYLETELSIPEESVHEVAVQLVKSVSKVVDNVRKLFLFQRFLDSVKFALLLWLMTFIGSWFSGITLVIVGDVVLFTVPKFYRIYQKQIDNCLALMNAKLEMLLQLIQKKFQQKKKSQ